MFTVMYRYRFREDGTEKWADITGQPFEVTAKQLAGKIVRMKLEVDLPKGEIKNLNIDIIKR